MEREDLADIVIDSVLDAKEIASGELESIGTIDGKKAQDYLNELRNFYNRPENRGEYAKDFRNHLAERFSISFEKQFAGDIKLAKKLKFKRNILYAATGISGACGIFAPYALIGTAFFFIGGISNQFMLRHIEEKLGILKDAQKGVDRLKIQIANTSLEEISKVYSENEKAIAEYIQ